LSIFIDVSRLFGGRRPEDGLEILQHLLFFRRIDGQVHVQLNGMRGIRRLCRRQYGARRQHGLQVRSSLHVSPI